MHAWIAFLAVLFSALAPSISHALAVSSGTTAMTEICTTSGVKVVVAAKSGLPEGSDDLEAHWLKHCPCCATHAGSFALPPPSTAVFTVLGVHDVFPPLFYSAPRPLSCWTSANPRAPPASA